MSVATPPTRRPALPSSTTLARFAWRPVVGVAGATSAILLAIEGRYGVHRDEFYYLAGGRRPAWGYVDHPPITPLLARAQAALFGTSAWSFRVFPSLAAGAAVLIAALIARELGGRRTAQLLAAVVAALLPAIRGPHLLFGTTSTDQFFWAVLLLLAARLLRTRDPRWWLAFGGVAGVGLLDKQTVLFVILLVVGGLVLTPERRLLANRWAFLGAVMAALIWTPNVVWQATHGFPIFAMSAAINGRDGGSIGGLGNFVLESVALWAVVGLFIAYWGWRWLLRSDAGRRYRALGLGALLVVPVVALSGGKAYYVAPIALLLVPAAAVAAEAHEVNWRRLVTPFLIAAAVSAIFTLPLLPADRLDAVTPLNKEFAEMVGWHDLAQETADVYHGLTPDEQARAVVFTDNYGEAGALELYREQYGLPAVYSGHNSYADWGTPPDGAVPVIVVGVDADDMTWCADAVPAGTVRNHQHIDNDENGAPLTICRSLTEDWSALWPSLRHVG